MLQHAGVQPVGAQVLGQLLGHVAGSGAAGAG